MPEIEGLKGWGQNGVGWVNGRRDGGLVIEEVVIGMGGVDGMTVSG